VDGNPANQEQIPSGIEVNLQKISRSFLNAHQGNGKFKPSFDQDFITSKPNFSQVVENLRLWRDRLFNVIDKVDVFPISKKEEERRKE